MMRRLISLLVAGMAIAALPFVVTSYDPRWLGFDWASKKYVPVKVLNDLEIGEAGGPLKRGSLRVLCSPEGVHIKMQSRIPAYWEDRLQEGSPEFRDQRTQVLFDHTVSESGVKFRRFETVSSFARWTPFDILVTRPLTATQRSALVDWFERGSPQSVSVHLLETASKFNGRGSASDVSDFISRCDQTVATSARVAASTSS